MYVWVEVKVKVNLSLCLTKYHAMRMYLMLNEAPHCEDILGIGSIASQILNRGTRLEVSG
jgi:hypothetical protein